MKISIDQEKCIGCQTCVLSCPECFEMQGNIARVIKEDCNEDDCDVVSVVEQCPVEAIKIEKLDK